MAVGGTRPPKRLRPDLAQSRFDHPAVSQRHASHHRALRLPDQILRRHRAHARATA
ncbi:hypothetical protein BCEN4_20003 [Burkholderia cenocepacia]|nr:hypothetical protein BCEN4_20003 [Burkholderia cenocepacia]